MPVILNFSSERVLSESELEALRHVGRVSQSELILPSNSGHAAK
ncbi:T3SS secreted effector NleG-like protein [Escherichia coli]|nr:T3SS secreted effector NleG-like protein [Escherichia coli]CTV12202.1 T3SS secreted effector NleG-like protein [Escherichia coli]CTY35733.1 T3SS secreted effector NleG-like protein [Escherichia coli]